MSDENEMTPQERELEQALRTLRPAAAWIDAETMAAGAARRSAERQRVRFAQLAAAAALAAVVAGVVWKRGISSRSVGEGGHAPEVVAVTTPPGPPPTELDYRQALLRSPAELDALLDRQAVMSAAGEQDAEIPRAGVVLYWRSDVSSPPGAL
jgi:hypothetical protein